MGKIDLIIYEEADHNLVMSVLQIYRKYISQKYFKHYNQTMAYTACCHESSCLI